MASPYPYFKGFPSNLCTYSFSPNRATCPAHHGLHYTVTKKNHVACTNQRAFSVGGILHCRHSMALLWLRVEDTEWRSADKAGVWKFSVELTSNLVCLLCTALCTWRYSSEIFRSRCLVSGKKKAAYFHNWDDYQRYEKSRLLFKWNTKINQNCAVDMKQVRYSET